MPEEVQTPSSNISKGEFVAIQELKGNKGITILHADKGRATVIINTTDYETKMTTLLNDPTTYEPLAKDPTAPYTRIKRWQSQDPIPQQLKHRIYPTAEEVTRIYGLSKIHKPDIPLRPIVASRGGITNNAARVLADILSSLVGHLNATCRTTVRLWIKSGIWRFHPARNSYYIM